MVGSRRVSGSRGQRKSAWLSTLILESLALLAIFGVAQPASIQRLLPRADSKAAPMVAQPVYQPTSDFVHPMDAFQPPMITPAPLPNHAAQNYGTQPRIQSYRGSGF